jgi:hypothetical protein
MHPRLVFVDLPKDRRPEVYRFRPPRGEAKGGGGAFHLLGKSKLCSRKNAHRRCGILRRSKPSSTSVKVDCPKLVTDLGRPRFDVMETEVTHGRGTPLMSRSPRPFYQNRHRVPIAQALGAVARPEGPGPLECGPLPRGARRSTARANPVYVPEFPLPNRMLEENARRRGRHDDPRRRDRGKARSTTPPTSATSSLCRTWRDD